MATESPDAPASDTAGDAGALPDVLPAGEQVPEKRDAGASLDAFPRWSVGTRKTYETTKLGMVGALIYHVYVGCADKGGASFAIDALRSSAHPTTLGVKYAASNRGLK